MKSLCVLHALAWPEEENVKIGAIRVDYADGSSSEIPVRSRVDAGNWTEVAALPNGRIAWTSKDQSRCLFMSVFPVESKPVAKLSFSSEGKSVWLIVAASSSMDAVCAPLELPFAIVQSKDWKPMKFQRDVVPGSALDFSGLLDAPAGKYGRVVCKGESFEFEKAPGRQQRFYGVNMCFWSGNKGWSHESYDRLAERLAASGFNSVRLHAYDSSFAKKGAPSTELSPEALDGFDYFFAALKKRGIYMSTDLYVNRPFAKGDIADFDGPSKDLDTLKMLIPVSESALENWKAFAKALLTHVNPYSGLAWKDDPALFSISLVNENTVYFQRWRIEKAPAIKAIYDAKFELWLKAKGLSSSMKDQKGLQDLFYIETFEAAFIKMRDYARSLGVRQPLTEQNNGCEVPLCLPRAKYDYVDNHFYYEFPKFLGSEWGLPMAIDNKSAIASLNPDQAACFPTRLFGKPFMITEFNWVYPNASRAESGIIVPAYSALQGWSGLYLYQYSAGGEKDILSDSPATRWELCKEPVQTLAMRIGSMLYLRGDVAESGLLLPVGVDSGCLESQDCRKHFPSLTKRIGLLGKTGYVLGENGKFSAPAGCKAILALNPSAVKESNAKALDAGKGSDKANLAELSKLCDFGKGSFDLDALQVKSSTGELELDALAKTFKVSTSRSEAIIAPGAGAFRSGSMSIDNKYGFACFFVTALDGKDLKSSSRLLVLHLTDAVGSGLKFRSKEMKVVESMGGMPRLARRGEASMKLALDAKGAEWTLRSLDFGGATLSSSKIKAAADGSVDLALDTFAGAEPCMAYELVR